MSSSLRPHGIVHGILQARILEWVAIPFSQGSSQPREQTQVSHIAGGFFTSWAIREACNVGGPVRFLGREDPLEKGYLLVPTREATHPSILGLSDHDCTKMLEMVGQPLRG